MSSTPRCCKESNRGLKGSGFPPVTGAPRVPKSVSRTMSSHTFLEAAPCGGTGSLEKRVLMGEKRVSSDLKYLSPGSFIGDKVETQETRAAECFE